MSPSGALFSGSGFAAGAALGAGALTGFAAATAIGAGAGDGCVIEVLSPAGPLNELPHFLQNLESSSFPLPHLEQNFINLLASRRRNLF
jgi:hypothetical protein